MNDRPTPETDDRVRVLKLSGTPYSYMFDAIVEHAENLERGRDLWKAEAERWREIKGWQSIETAPRDGTTLLLFAPHDAAPTITGFWCSARKAWRVLYAHQIDASEPTHWMPLPEPPQS